jgi:Leucine-rich repeat (LRR) protein
VHTFQLKYLYLSGNLGLDGELPSMAALTSLEGLYIANTNFSGSLSCELALLPNLKSVEASNTQLTPCQTLDCLQLLPDCMAKSAQKEHGVEL